MATTSISIPPLPTAAAAAPAHRRRPQWRRLVSVGLAALVAAGAVVGVLAYRRSHKATPASRYETAAIDRGRIVARVTATGTLSALVTVQVGSQVSGRIQKLYVDFNSPVKKGQVVAEIDPQLFRAAAAQAKANRDAARGNLAKARAPSRRRRAAVSRARARCAAQQLVAQADLDTARAEPRRGHAPPSMPTPARVEQARGGARTRRASTSATRRSSRRSTASSSRATSTSGRRWRRRSRRRRCSPSPRTCARCRSTPTSPRPTSASCAPA